MIKAILIDVDNTILDFDAYVQKSMEDGFVEFGLGTYEPSMFEIFKTVNNRLWRMIEEGTLTFSQLTDCRWNKVFERLGISFDGRKFETYFRNCLYDSAIEVDGAISLLSYLSERYILGVASNGPYEQQMHRLEIGGMTPYFTEFFISEKVGASKPSKEFFSHCFERLSAFMENSGREKLSPSEIMMIGDSLTSDIEGAKNMGFKTCFFDKNKEHKTNGLEIDRIVYSLDEIKSFM